LIDGHYGVGDTLTPAMVLNHGSGRINDDGPYLKATSGPTAHQGAVYAVAGSSGQVGGGRFNHPAMYISLSLLGSVVLDIDGNALNAQFLRADGVIGDYFTIIKGSNPNALRVTSFGIHEYISSLTWISIPGRYYQVQFTRQLNPIDWTDVREPVLATESSTSWAEFIPGDAPTGFFRVVLLPD
jgi:hypothetical protein